MSEQKQNKINPFGIFSEIQSGLEIIEMDVKVFEALNFVKRAAALDFIEFHIIDRIEGLRKKNEQIQELEWLRKRADSIKMELEKIDTYLFMRLRQKIRKAKDKSLVFSEVIFKYSGISVDDIKPANVVGFDHLDLFVNGLLSDAIIPEIEKEPEPEMIFYQKTPVRIIFELVKVMKMARDDVFFDLGSGIGQAVILVHLMSDARAKGIEYEPAFCNYATQCAADLNLINVEFIREDARKADYSKGTIFFMYTPFVGEMLKEMLEILRQISRERAIRIFTYGPCSVDVSQQNWLYSTDDKVENDYRLYEFRSKKHAAIFT